MKVRIKAFAISLGFVLYGSSIMVSSSAGGYFLADDRPIAGCSCLATAALLIAGMFSVIFFD